MERERTWSTEEMVRRWRWHNDIRTVVLLLGTVAGALGVSMSVVEG